MLDCVPVRGMQRIKSALGYTMLTTFVRLLCLSVYVWPHLNEERTMESSRMSTHQNMALPVNKHLADWGRNLQDVTSNDIAIVPSPSDGHCPLHLICESWKQQLSRSEVPLETVQNLVFIEAVKNRDRYLPFMSPSTSTCYATGLKSYLIHKQYNQAFGDLVPLMLANVLHVNIRILERRDSEGHYNMVTVGPSDLPSLVILVIHKHGEHCSTLLLSPFTW